MAVILLSFIHVRLRAPFPPVIVFHGIVVRFSISFRARPRLSRINFAGYSQQIAIPQSEDAREMKT